MFMSIYPALHKKWPDLSVTPIEMGVRAQQAAIAKGDIDIGFVTLADKEKTNDHYIDLCTEDFVLIAPKMYPFTEYAIDDSGEFPLTDLDKFKEEPFALMHSTSTMRDITDRLFAKHGFQPHVLFNSSSTTSLLNMTELGLCCALIPKFYLKKADPDKILAFSLKEHPSWKLSITYRSGSYLSDSAHTFIALASEYWKAQ